MISGLVSVMININSVNCKRWSLNAQDMIWARIIILLITYIFLMINYLNKIMQSMREQRNQDLERGDTITSFAPITSSLAKVGVARQPGDNAHREAAELVKTSLHFS